MKINLGRYPRPHAKNQERKISVKIEKFDTWNMNNTLALIIHPMLIQLKETKHGAPYVDDSDVPWELRSTSIPETRTEEEIACGHTDTNFFLRWDHVLDEMIWAFGQVNIDWEEQFYSGEIDHITVPIERNGMKLIQWQNGPNHTFKVDKDGLKSHRDRIQNGFCLFGKYYEALWD